MNTNRRNLLKTIAAGATASLAGCPSTQQKHPDQETETSNNTKTNTPEETPEETATEQPLPEEYEVNIVPGKNTELRNQIPQSQLSQYQREFEADVITSSNVFSQASSQEFRNMEVDLLALEYWHDNDFSNLNQLGRHRGELETIVKSIDGLTTQEAQQIINEYGSIGGSNIKDPEELRTKVEEAKNHPESKAYPNSKGESNSYGQFDYKQLSNSQTAGEALDWIHPYLFSLEEDIDMPAISTEDEKFAAVIQQSIDQYTQVNIHAWAFDLPRSNGNTHGNGLIWDQDNDELRVLETITGPTTFDYGDKFSQLHPLIEDSNYLPPELREEMGGQTSSDNTAYREWWHPIRFQGQAPKNKPINFRAAKGYAAMMFRGMATAFEDTPSNEDTEVTPTTGYIEDITEKLRNYNQNDIDFNEILNQSKVYSKLRSSEEDFLVGGTVEDPWYVKVGDDFNHDAVWEDQEGEYDNYVEELEPQTTETAQSLGKAGKMLEAAV